MKIVSMVNCKLDLNAILTDNGAGGSPALLFVKFFYHQPFVTSVTKTSKAGLPLFLSAKGYLGISKSETDPFVVWCLHFLQLATLFDFSNLP
jgi:hypothetical protein